jgi:hypothetical protein
MRTQPSADASDLAMASADLTTSAVLIWPLPGQGGEQS